MSAMGSGTIADPIAHRDWDSRFFGFTVGEITDPNAGDDSIFGLLHSCQITGTRLVYWAVPEGRTVNESLLARFGGQFVDRKITYSRNLVQARPTAVSSSGWRVDEEPSGPAARSLEALAVQAGAFSRFRVDPKIPAGKFEELYRIWMERSTLRQIADVVLVAKEAGRIGGMVTIALHPTAARIGLFAVDPEHQRQGVGRALMAAAHGWMLAHGARKASVVTQGANEAACRLYEKSGHTIESVCYFYHFWPLEATL